MVIGFDLNRLSKAFRTFLWVLLMGAVVFGSFALASLTSLAWLSTAIIVFGMAIGLIILIKILNICSV